MKSPRERKDKHSPAKPEICSDSSHHVLLKHAPQGRGLCAAPSPRWLLCVCTGVSEGVAECVTVSLRPSSCFTPSGVVPLLAGEGREVDEEATPQVRKQLVSKALYLLPEPFYLSDKKQYTKQWFPTSSPPFPYCRAGRGRGSSEEPPPSPLGPQIRAVLRVCSVPRVMYVHGCVHVSSACVHFGGLGDRRLGA